MTGEKIARLALAVCLIKAACFAQQAKPASGVSHGHSAQSQRKSPTRSGERISFIDITKRAGLSGVQAPCGTKQKLYIMDALCGGIGFIDYNNDGWPDIVLINGATLSTMKSNTPAIRIFRNNHDRTFTEVTRQSGLAKISGWGMGVAVGDYDNDGFDDLYVTFIDHALLLHNEHGRSFVDVTKAAGVGNAGHWGTSAAFADYDNDGFLDLYVANYVDIDLQHLPEFGSGPFCQYRGIKVSCGPRGLKGGRDRLFHNNGNGTFTDVTSTAGIDPDKNYGLGVLWLDYNHDGCEDIYVSDDSSPSMLYKGDCKGHFQDVGTEAGVAYSSDGLVQAGMGVDAGDYDRDGWPDIAKINFSDDVNNLYRNNSDGTFTDTAGSTGFGPVSRPFLGFGVKFFDADNDGWPDIFIANGHVNPQLDAYPLGVSYKERNFLFHNIHGKFREIAQQSGQWLQVPRVGRGVAVADIDNDGRLDLLVSNLDQAPILALNNSKNNNGSLTIKLIGTKSNRDAIGARVTVKTNGLTQVDEVRANSSYLSASDLRLHFGLGRALRVDEIDIEWPSGLKQSLPSEATDQELVIEEGVGVTKKIPFPAPLEKYRF